MSDVSFTEQEFEELSNFARLAGFINVKTALLSMFSLRRPRTQEKLWRYCPSCGAEYVIEGSGEITGQGKLIHLLKDRNKNAKLYLGDKSLLYDGKLLVYDKEKFLLETDDEAQAVFALCGQAEKTLFWFLYETGLPYEIRSNRRVLTLDLRLYSVYGKTGKLILTTRDEETAINALENGVTKNA